MKLRAALLAAVACTGLLTGCQEVEQAINQGGDTSCKDYLQQNSDDQRVTITKFVKQRANNDHEPSGTAVDATMVAVQFLCSSQRNADTQIKNANLSGRDGSHGRSNCQGHRTSCRSQWTPRHHRRLGGAVRSRAQSCSRDYRPRRPTCGRPHFDADRVVAGVRFGGLSRSLVAPSTYRRFAEPRDGDGEQNVSQQLILT
jgi:acid stress chaperone HdeA